MPPLSNLHFSGNDQVSPAFVMKTSKPLHQGKQQRNVVYFATNAVIHDTIHVSDISEEEKEGLWYNKHELRRIKDEAKIIANMSVASNSEDAMKTNADPCRRGLEAKTTAGAKKRRQNRIDARAAVFLEQEIQEDDGLSDPDTLAEIYFKYTEGCQVEAQLIAMRDEQEAREIYEAMKASDVNSVLGKLLFLAPVSGSAAA